MYGLDGDNECPAGSLRITTAVACQAAAVAAGIAYTSPGSQSLEFANDPTVPRGCYAYTRTGSTMIMFFNAHAVGAGKPRYSLLCSKVTAAPTNRGDAFSFAGTSGTRAALNRRPYDCAASTPPSRVQARMRSALLAATSAPLGLRASLCPRHANERPRLRHGRTLAPRQVRSSRAAVTGRLHSAKSA